MVLTKANGPAPDPEPQPESPAVTRWELRITADAEVIPGEPDSEDEQQ